MHPEIADEIDYLWHEHDAGIAVEEPDIVHILCCLRLIGHARRWSDEYKNAQDAWSCTDDRNRRTETAGSR